MKRMIFYGWLACIAITRVAIACSCTPLSSAPVCELISSTEVVFLGTVTKIDEALYHMRVQKVYKGLDPGTTEVVLDRLTVCSSEYRLGGEYIIFASWSYGSAPTLMSGMCSGSRPAKSHPEDIAALDRYLRGEPKTTVSGRVLQWVTAVGRPIAEEDAPVPGALVTLDGNGTKVYQRADHGGRFQFSGIPSGSYSITARREPYEPQARPVKVDVAMGACAEVFPLLHARAGISGTLQTISGNPAKRERVELLRRNGVGGWYSTAQFWTETDEFGRFRFADLPSGDYLLGYEIWHDKPSTSSRYATRYFPGVANRKQGTILHIDPKQNLTGLSFRLPKADTPRRIRVAVKWPDGSAPTSHFIQLFDDDDLLQNVRLPQRDTSVRHTGVFQFDGYEERTYSFRAIYWIDDWGSPGPDDQPRIATTEVVQLKPGKGAVEVSLILSKKLLKEDIK